MISQTAEYALRAAVFLASRATDSPASAQEIAEATRVPVGYLQKILRTLAKHDLLTAHRGTNGGFALAKVPSAISVLDILRASDTPIQRIERCPLGIKGHTTLCTLHRLLDAELARAERTFASTSLSDLLDGNGGIRPLCDARGRFPVSMTVSRNGSSHPHAHTSE
ncbi:MAG: Rrf2 family transcriptional regulator [Leptolyngbya sp. PLA2]|nr:Rrf2 family transcriptional regulator [Leptolyngbya sp.]MCE7972306.1 Rrf2 family transcriptional regulator [Leptolyngbya sp. PL-A2]MCQ3939502.1 transcriptional regulator [cyanobacterium CYA1]MCZ7632242.1 Rrf2 family transcriptional regulator [Phycisphaerales bacterium]GIK18484.1 MAG: transcriptional regulator [Planctomycetota bacterium]